MAQSIGITTNYNGDLIPGIVTYLMTGNQLVEGGHVHIEGGIKDTAHIPRLSGQDFIQEYKPTPTPQGTFTHDEVTIDPQRYMVYAEFDPNQYEDLWRPYQPTGELNFRRLDPGIQGELMGEILREVQKFLGNALLNGDTAGGTFPYDRFNGLITRLENSGDTITVSSTTTLSASNIFGELEKGYNDIPDAVFEQADLKLFMNVSTWKFYQKALTDLDFKGPDETGTASRMYKGFPIVVLSDFPSDAFMFAQGNTSRGSNLWVGVDDTGANSNLQVEKLQANSDLWFFKMNMKTDTQVVKPSEVILYKN